MPSPFPGMDPYIEHPEIWSDFHGDLAAQIRADLNKVIQPRYVARLVPRVTYEVVEMDRPRSVRPDVGVGARGAVRTEVAAKVPLPSRRPWRMSLQWSCRYAFSRSKSLKPVRLS